MADYTERDARRAEEISRALLEEGAPADELDEGFSIADIEVHAAEFRNDLTILSEVGADVPAMRFGDSPPVPVSLSELGLYPHFIGPLGRRRFLRDYYYDDIKYALRDRGGSGLGIETISEKIARRSFMGQATEFLATRLAAVRASRDHYGASSTKISQLNILQRAGGARTSAPGCSFSVSSNSPGLIVYWTGAYYVSSNYFGHPTSPAVNILQAGTYSFGVVGGAYGSKIQWDKNATCSLPGLPSVHLNF